MPETTMINSLLVGPFTIGDSVWLQNVWGKKVRNANLTALGRDHM